MFVSIADIVSALPIFLSFCDFKELSQFLYLRSWEIFLEPEGYYAAGWSVKELTASARDLNQWSFKIGI